MVEKTKSWCFVRWLDSSCASLFAEISDDLDHLLSNKAYLRQQYKHDRTTTVALIEFKGKPLVIKRYNARSQWHKVKRALRQSRARRCWVMAQAFSKAGLNIASPLLMQEQRLGLLHGDAYLVSEYLEGETLLEVLPSMTSEQQKSVSKAVFQAFDLMRQHRITHGDMKASNLIWYKDALYFIDLDAAKSHRLMQSWEHSHRKDVKRFLKNWHGQPSLLALFEGLD